MDLNEVTSQDVPKIRYKAAASGLFISLGAAAAIILLVNPKQGGPIAILLFLTAVFFVALCGALLILQFAARLLKSKRTQVNLFHSALSLATGLVFLFGLQTLGQLGVIDILLVIAFEILINFYLIRRF